MQSNDLVVDQLHDRRSGWSLLHSQVLWSPIQSNPNFLRDHTLAFPSGLSGNQPTSLDPAPSFPHLSLIFGNQAPLDTVQMEYNYPEMFFGSRESANPWVPGVEYAISEEHMAGCILQSTPGSAGLPTFSASQRLCELSPDLQTSSLGPCISESSQFTEHPMSLRPFQGGIDQSQTKNFLEDIFSFSHAGPAPKTCSLPYPVHEVQQVESPSYFDSLRIQPDYGVLDTVSTPFTLIKNLPIVQQEMLVERIIGFCQWKAANGELCNTALSKATVPEHLSTHGMEGMHRDHPVKCGWLNCKRRKPMNRESIVRHTREVHLCLRRRQKTIVC